jgi:hypothetical protein
MIWVAMPHNETNIGLAIPVNDLLMRQKRIPSDEVDIAHHRTSFYYLFCLRSVFRVIAPSSKNE